MKKYILRLAFFVTLFISLQSKAQFPSTDSLHKYNNHWIRNSAVEAFSQLRLNTLLHGMIDWIDSAGLITGDTLFVVPGGSNGNGDTGSIRYNDTLFIFEVSKDTLWIPMLLYAHNGLTKNADSVRWGGTLDRATTITQAGNGITFEGGAWRHAHGDYLDYTTRYSTIYNDSAGGFGVESGDEDYSAFIQATRETSLGAYAQIQATASGIIAGVTASVVDGVVLSDQQGRLFARNLTDSSQAYQLYINPTNWKVTYGLAGGGGGGPAGAVYAANGLSNVNDSTIKLGGTLTENTTISASTYETVWSGSYSSSGSLFSVQNSSSGIAFGATNNGSSATGSFTNSGSGNSLLLTGSSGIPLRAVTTTGSAAGTFQVNPTSTNSVVNLLELNRVTSSTAAAGLGGAIRFNLEAADGSFYLANRIISKWTDAAVSTRTSSLQIEGVDDGTTSTIFSLLGNGQLALNKYGVGNFSGSAVYGLGVDASGNIVETDATSSGGGADDWGTQNVAIGWGLTGNGDETDLEVDSSVVATQTDLADARTTVSAGAGISVSGNPSSGYTITNSGAPGTNPMNVLSIMDYGGVEGVTIGGGNYATGTDNTPALDSAIADADDGQWIVVPPGDYLFSSALDTITGSGSKKVYLLFLGNVYTAGNDFIRIKNASGAYEQHKIVFEGNIVGRINMPSHSKSGSTRSSPTWSDFAGVPVKLINVNQTYVQFNKVEGTKAPFEIIGGGCSFCGSQENVIMFRYFYKNAIGALLTSVNGDSYCDKNYIGGYGGAAGRVSGGLAIKMDGYSGAASSNGEAYNGAMRSNTFKFLIEQCDSIAIANADANYNEFDITIEGGTNTGVLGSDPWQMRVSSPNYVQYSKFTGRGYYDVSRLGSGSTGSMGRDATINVPLFYNNATHLGNSAITDASGNVIIDVRSNLAQSTISALPAFVKTSRITTEIKATTTTSAASYSIASSDYVVMCNGAGAVVVINMPSAASWPQREVFVRNISTTGGTVSVSGGDPSANNSIASGQGGIHYRSDGTNWRVIAKWHD
jgi:hypothetical protein